ncbi:MAG: hypothetical protein WC658_04865 [Candidatus Omnitrophota bacterium]
MKKLEFLIILIFGFFSLCFADESLTITTYFPSPYGVYNELQLYAHNPAVTTCDDAHKGTMFYKSTDDQVYVCKGATLGWQAVGGSTPDYDSGWIAETNADHIRTFTHNLNVLPTRIQIWFSPDNPPSSWISPMGVDQMNYPQVYNNYKNPSGITINTTQIILGYYSGVYLFSRYKAPLDGTWYNYSSGYVRVLLWK